MDDTPSTTTATNGAAPAPAPAPAPRAPRKRRRFRIARPIFFAAVMALVGAGVAFGGTQALTWMETPEFCGQCHTMTPEVAAHVRSPHADVECAECHVGPGITGLAKAKIGGMRQMLELILGDYARPIPPAADTMPPATDTCTRCHDPGRSRSDVLITRTRYGQDEQNTPQQVGLVMRLSHGPGETTEGIHWHVQQKVDFVPGPGDDATSTVPWVSVDKADGTHKEFIALGSDTDSTEQLAARINAWKGQASRQMSCYDCHNRVGHDFPKPETAIDLAMSDGTIDRSIPFIKKNAAELVTRRFESVDAFDGELRAMMQRYAREYPYLFLERPQAMEQSFAAVRDIYLRADHPAMNAQAADYPNLLGHTASTGCFRCHDGAHARVVDGKITSELIPSACSTCHTFPSVGQTSLAPLGQPPSSHAASLWVFQHKSAPGATNPTAQTCGACHAQSYCQNCHSSPVASLKHDRMLFTHADEIRKKGQAVCSSCHQKPFCATCHTSGVPQ